MPRPTPCSGGSTSPSPACCAHTSRSSRPAALATSRRGSDYNSRACAASGNCSSSTPSAAAGPASLAEQQEELPALPGHSALGLLLTGHGRPPPASGRTRSDPRSWPPSGPRISALCLRDSCDPTPGPSPSPRLSSRPSGGRPSLRSLAGGDPDTADHGRLVGHIGQEPAVVRPFQPLLDEGAQDDLEAHGELHGGGGAAGEDARTVDQFLGQDHEDACFVGEHLPRSEPAYNIYQLYKSRRLTAGDEERLGAART